MENNEKTESNTNDHPSTEDAFKFLDAIISENKIADQQIIDLIRKKLHQENVQFNSSVITSVCTILEKFYNTPSLELLEECLQCFQKPMSPNNEQG